MKTIEDMLRDGAEKLAAKREQDRAAAEEKEHKMKEAQCEFWMKARAALATQIPAELIALSNLPWDGPMNSFSEISFEIPGCVPIYANILIDSKGAYIESRYWVPGVRSYDPYISQDSLDMSEDLVSGQVQLLVYEEKPCDAGYPKLHNGDLEVVLALAKERGEYVQRRREEVEAKYAALQLEVQNQKEAALTLRSPDGEAVYIPAEEDKPAQLLNIGELVSLVRGVTLDVLAERGL